MFDSVVRQWKAKRKSNSEIGRVVSDFLPSLPELPGDLSVMEAIVDSDIRLQDQRRRGNAIIVVIAAIAVVAIGQLGLVGLDMYFRATVPSYASPPWAPAALASGPIVGLFALLRVGRLADWLFTKQD